MKGYCVDCGAKLKNGKARRCRSCKEKHELALRKKWAEDHKITVKCERCGELFMTVARSTRATARYCSRCRPLLQAENRAKRREVQQRKKAAGPRVIKLPPASTQTTRPKRPEPKGNHDSLDHVIWKLEQINEARHGAGLPPISYGKYVSSRGKETGKK